MESVSAAVIVKNEEENLPRLLKSISGKFREIVVVDTGSTDKSMEIAESFGAKVYSREWKGFSDARNYAAQKCSGEWIWHFDADFELEEGEYDRFKELLSGLKDSGIKGIGIYVKNYGLDGTLHSISSQAFIHKNERGILWTGNIHEKLNIQTVQFPVYINHYGYQKAGVQKKKALRNLELIKKDMDIYRGRDDYEYYLKLFYILQTYNVLSSFDSRYINEGLKYENEFLFYYERMKDSSSSFFITYGAYYYISLLIFAKRYDDAMDFLKRVEKDGGTLSVDLHYLKFKIVKAVEEPSVCRTIMDYFISLDEVEQQNRPVFIDSLNNVSSLVDEFVKRADEDVRSYLEKEWKRRRSKSLAYLLARIYKELDSMKYQRFMKKLTKLFDSELAEVDFADFLYLNKEFQEAKKYAWRVLNKNGKNRRANEILGLIAMEEGDYMAAVEYFMKVIKYNEASEVLPHFYEALNRAGFGEEAEKLKIKSRFAKKIFQPSDNKSIKKEEVRNGT